MKHKEQFFAAVGIIFDKENKVLLTQRWDPKDANHGKWQFPGGGIEYGENPINTLHREIKEETGIEIELLSETPILYDYFFPDSHGIFLIFPARYRSGEIDVSQDPETADAKWYNINEIDFETTIPDVEKLLKIAEKYL